MFAPVGDGRIVFPAVPAAADEALLDGPERHKHRDDEKRREHRDGVVAESDGHTHWRGHPDRRRGGQPVHIVTSAQDRSSSEEPDPGDDLGGNACRIDGFSERGQEAERREHASPDGTRAYGLHSCGVTSNLAFRPQNQTEDQSDDEAETQLGLAVERQLLQPRPGRPPGLSLAPGSSGSSGRSRLFTKSLKTARRSSSTTVSVLSLSPASSSASGMMPAVSMTSVATKIGHSTRTASAMASDGRASKSRSRPFCLT